MPSDDFLSDYLIPSVILLILATVCLCGCAAAVALAIKTFGWVMSL